MNNLIDVLLEHVQLNLISPRTANNLLTRLPGLEAPVAGIVLAEYEDNGFRAGLFPSYVDLEILEVAKLATNEGNAGAGKIGALVEAALDSDRIEFGELSAKASDLVEWQVGVPMVRRLSSLLGAFRVAELSSWTCLDDLARIVPMDSTLDAVELELYSLLVDIGSFKTLISHGEAQDRLLDARATILRALVD